MRGHSQTQQLYQTAIPGQNKSQIFVGLSAKCSLSTGRVYIFRKYEGNLTHRLVAEVLDATVEVGRLAHQPGKVVRHGGVEVRSRSGGRQFLQEVCAETSGPNSACKTKFTSALRGATLIPS
jgi:hypothetical protein